MPKIDVGIPLYPLELLTVLLLPLYRSLVICMYTKILVAVTLYSLVSLIVASVFLDVFFIEEFLLLVKYLLPVFLYSILRMERVSFNQASLLVLILLVVLNFLYVLLSYFMGGVSVADAMWGYAHDSRVIGMTGLSLGVGGLTTIGNNSVAFGVYLSFLVIISFEWYRLKPMMSLFATVILLAATLFTYSRSGIVVIAVYFILKAIFLAGRLSISIRMLIGFFSLLPIVYQYGDALGVVSKLASFSDFSDSSSSIRIGYWVESVKILFSNVPAFLFGTGYSESIQFLRHGFANSESLYFTAAVQLGLFGVVGFLLLQLSFVSRTNGLDDFVVVLSKALNYFVPGWILSCLVGGDLLRTDFFIYFVILVKATIDNAASDDFSARQGALQQRVLYR